MTKCQCDCVGEVSEDRLHLYDEITERPYVNHAPGECACTNKIDLYRRNGKAIWLCSICNLIGDLKITEEAI